MKLQNVVFTFLLFILANTVFAQQPTHAPKPQDSAVDFSRPENVVLFIVLPIVVVILYFVWRRAKRNDQTE